jgi:hypothetical protein
MRFGAGKYWAFGAAAAHIAQPYGGMSAHCQSQAGVLFMQSARLLPRSHRVVDARLHAHVAADLRGDRCLAVSLDIASEG